MRDRVTRLFKDFTIYGIGSIAVRSVGLVTLPIYTRYLSPSEYGLIELITIFQALLGSVIGLGQKTAQSVFYFEQSKNDIGYQREVFTAIFKIRSMWGVFVIFACIMSGPVINSFIFNRPFSIDYLILIFTTALFVETASQSASMLRLLHKPWSFTVILLVQSIVSVTIIISLLLVMDNGITAIIVGNFIGAMISVVFSLWLVREYLDFTLVTKKWWPKLIRFGMPLIPLPITVWIMNVSDRVLIMNILGVDATGIYAVGAKFSILIAVATNVFRIAWLPIALESAHEEEGKEFIRKVAIAYLALGFIGVILLGLISKDLVILVAGQQYEQSYSVVAILSLASVFNGYLLFSQIGMLKEKKTKEILYVSTLSALINIGLNLLFIPIFGILGAAIATAFSLYLRNYISTSISERAVQIGILQYSMWLKMSLVVTVLVIQLTLTGYLVWLISLISILLIAFDAYKKINYSLSNVYALFRNSTI